MTNTELAFAFYNAFDTNQPELLNNVLDENWQALPSVQGNPGGLNGQKGTVAFLHSIFKDFSYRVVEVIDANTETIVTRAQLCGVQIGEFLGVQPTNRKIVMDTIEIHKVKGNKIYATYHIEDFFGAFIQMTRG